MNNIFSLNNVSKYRSELMGYSMIGVLICHIIVFGDLEEYKVSEITSYFSGWLHTPGFLFLSGLGIFYSLSNDSDPLLFYTRRFYRFFLPFLILAIPFWSAVMIFKHESIWFLIRCITTWEFWVNGNYMGMWYIAISLVLYVSSPLFYKFVKNRTAPPIVKILLLIIAAVLLDILVSTIYPSYYAVIKIGLSRIPYYFLGFLFAYLLKLQLDRKKELLVIILILLVGCYPLISTSHVIYIGLLRVACSVIVLSSAFSLLHNSSISFINRFVSWFGTYSLELYILHLYFFGVCGIVLKTSPLIQIVVSVVLSVILCIPTHAVIDKICIYIKNKI